MTLPNMPWDSTDPEDLPQGAAYPGSSLGNLLQNPSVSKFANLGGGRFPGVFFAQPAGSPLNPSMPLGFITDLFAKFASYVAQADPATINKPEDLQGLITDFVVGLPLSSLGSASNPLEQMQTNIQAAFTDLDTMFDFYTGLFTTTSRIQTGIVNGWIDGDQTEAAPDVFATMRSIRTATTGMPWTRFVATSSQTWNKPEDFDLKEVVALAIAAGTNGANGNSTQMFNGPGGAGGLGGGFKAQSLNLEDFDALHITIGTAGSPAVVRADNGSGDVLLQALNGSPGATPSLWGYNASSSNGGNGGAGGNSGGQSNGTTHGQPGTAGGPTPAIPGGAGGAGGGSSSPYEGVSGSDGGSVQATTPVPCGGSGGGGGGGGGYNFVSSALGGNGGHGGAGGFPGGGGGGGGSRSYSAGKLGGNGGPGGAGLVLVFYRGEAIVGS